MTPTTRHSPTAPRRPSRILGPRARVALLFTIPALVAFVPLGTAHAGTPNGAPVRIASSDGAVLSSTIVGSRTRIVRVTPDPQRLLVVDGQFELRVVAPDGRRAALATPLGDGATQFSPGGRRTTTLAVADLVGGTVRTYEVAHNVEPEAFGFGLGSETLYVIDHRPARDPVSYRVAALDLNSGALRAVGGPENAKVPLDEMTATARRQVLAPSGRQLYTLYVETARTGGDAGKAGSSSHPVYSRADTQPQVWTTAFVHVLDLADGWAYCVNLPARFGLGAARTNAIAIDPAGRQLFVADTNSGSLAVIDTHWLTRASLQRAQPPVMEVTLPVGDGLTPFELTPTADGLVLRANDATWTLAHGSTTWSG